VQETAGLAEEIADVVFSENLSPGELPLP
jgi:hypothetical protein